MIGTVRRFWRKTRREREAELDAYALLLLDTPYTPVYPFTQEDDGHPIVLRSSLNRLLTWPDRYSVLSHLQRKGYVLRDLPWLTGDIEALLATVEDEEA